MFFSDGNCGRDDIYSEIIIVFVEFIVNMNYAEYIRGSYIA